MRRRIVPADENRIARRPQPIRRHGAIARRRALGAGRARRRRATDRGSPNRRPSASCRRRGSTPTIVSPGLIDLQVNGGFGFEVGGDAAALRALAARLPSTGVTTFLPAVVSAARGGLPGGRGRARRGRARGSGAPPSAQACRASPRGAAARRRRARGRTIARRSRRRTPRSTTCSTSCWRAGAVRLMTLAPERPGALARHSAAASRPA